MIHPAQEEEQYKIELLPKQREFVLNKKKYSCFSGGYGSGKTYAGCSRALMLSTLYENNVGLIGRLTYPELRSTTRKTFFEITPPSYYDDREGGVWKTSENYLRLINGSEIYFMHLDTVSESELRSLNLGWFYIDQAEEISSRVWDVLISRLRLANVPRRFGFITCNPDPTTWIYEKFKRPQDEGRIEKDYSIVESTSYENPYLPEGYAEGLEKSYDPEIAARYIYGRWDAFEGLIYKEFDASVHVIRPFPVPKEWEVIVGIDHGMVNPTAALWAAIDFDGNIFIFDSYYSAGIVSQHAKEILSRHTDRTISAYYIDPSTQAKTREKDGMPWSTLEEYEDYGLYAIPANNEVRGGINRVREFLKLQDHRINPVTGEKRSPKLFIFSTCQELIWEMKRYQWKRIRGLIQRNESETPQQYEDHACDALRYIIMTRFPSPLRKPTGFEMVMPNTPRNIMAETTFSPNYQGDEILGQFYGD